MKAKNLICFLIYLISILTIYGANIAYSAPTNSIEEYGIVIIPQNKCLVIAKDLNRQIKENLPELENAKNNFHVTLYQGAFDKKDIPKIKALITSINFDKINLKFTDFSDSENKWINWNVSNDVQLQKLHENIVRLANNFHKRPLDRSLEIYHTLSDKNKEQVDKYGIYGVVENYKPHLTLFYAYPSNEIIKKMPEIIKKSHNEDVICEGKEIAIGKLGHNGNLIKIIEKIPLI